MAAMSMNKAIHSAFRRDLNRFMDALSKFSAGDHARALQLQTAWKNFDHQLTRHHEGEHEIAWPAMESVGVSKEALAQMDAEHATMDGGHSLLASSRRGWSKFKARSVANTDQMFRAGVVPTVVRRRSSFTSHPARPTPLPTSRVSYCSVRQVCHAVTS